MYIFSSSIYTADLSAGTAIKNNLYKFTVSVKLPDFYPDQNLGSEEKTNQLSKKLSICHLVNFHSHLRFGIMCTDINRVFVLHKCAVRILANLKPGTYCRDEFKIFNILPAPAVYMCEEKSAYFPKKHYTTSL